MKVTVCITSWNCLEVLKLTMKVLRDSRCEIIVFDNGSTDGTPEYLSTVPNVISICVPKNVGNSISRNEMIKRATGEYILFLDCDIVPIGKSIEKMTQFMDRNREYDCLGYDYLSHSEDRGKLRREEVDIHKSDVIPPHEPIALTQYGLFRKSIFDRMMFPSFYPFNMEGYGSEDNILGMAMIENGMKIGMIKGRTYYHQAHSSGRQIKNYEATMLVRWFHRIYFELMLPPKEKEEALHSGKLKRTEIDMCLYADRTNQFIIDVCFPFLTFSKKSKKYLFFGGTNIPDHARLPKKTEYILYFGCGLSKVDQLDFPDYNYDIYPAGRASYRWFKEQGINSHFAVGNMLQFLMCMERLNSHGTGKFDSSSHSFTDIEKLAKAISPVETVVSKLHTIAFASAIMGKRTVIPQADIRDEDFTGYFRIPYSCGDKEIEIIRAKSKDYAPVIARFLLEELKKHKA